MIMIRRIDASQDWRVYDSVRGVDKFFGLNGNSDETTGDTAIASFDADGLSLGASTLNVNTGTYVCYAFKQGTHFQILDYTGNGASRDLAHGLDDTPVFLFVRQRDTATQSDFNRSVFWIDQFAANQKAEWDYDLGTDAVIWDNTLPDATNVSVGNSDEVNASGSSYVMYVFAASAGFLTSLNYSGDTTDFDYNAPKDLAPLGGRMAGSFIKRIDSTEHARGYVGCREVNVDNFFYSQYLFYSSLTPSTSQVAATTHDVIRYYSRDGSRNEWGGTYTMLAFTNTNEYLKFPESNLVGAWPWSGGYDGDFDLTVSVLYAIDTNEYNLANPVTSERPEYIHTDRVLDFDGVNESVFYVHGSELVTASAGFTLVLLATLEAVTGTDVLCGLGSRTEDTSCSLIANSSGYVGLRSQKDGGSVVTQVGSVDYRDATLHMWSLTVSSANLQQVYVDKNSTPIASTTSSFDYSTNELVGVILGGRFSNTFEADHGDLKVKGLFLFNKALTQAERDHIFDTYAICTS